MNSFISPHTPLSVQRRDFISQVLKASVAGALVFPSLKAHAQTRDYTVGEIMDMVLKEIPGAPFPQTVDTLKSGNREMVVTGIITTMFATVDIIHKAIAEKANFIIAHEPTFYNHTDDLQWVSPCEVVQMKKDLLEKNKITVWRLHDYLHSFRPDGVFYGVLQKAGWTSYYKTGSPILELPPISFGDLAAHLKKSLDIKMIRTIGSPTQSCKRVALLPGAAGGQRHLRVMETEQPDVLVVGEVHEWETAEYIRDARSLGKKNALIVLGHSVSEEPGLEWLKDWLAPRLAGLKVQHIETGNPFTFL